MAEAAFQFSNQYSIELEFFEGPIDLLLHLVQRKDVSVEEVDMTEICQQYLEIVNSSNCLDLDRMSEYLVIAATLLAIKSQQMLPTASSYADLLSDLPEGADSAFLEELRERIKLYELTKKRASVLLTKPQLGIDTFPRKATRIVEEDNFDYNSFNNESSSLGQMFVSLLHRIGETVKTYRVKLEPVNIVKLMMRSLDSLAEVPKKSFFSMIGGFLKDEKSAASEDGQNSGPANSGKQKSLIIGGFMAILELMKRGLIEAEQSDSNINLSLKMIDDTEAEDGELSEDGSVIDMMAYKSRIEEDDDIIDINSEKIVNE